MFGKAASTAVFSLLISISLNFGSESESQARSGDSANFKRIDSVEVDGVFLRYNQEDRNYLIACIISEIGNWKDTDYDKMKQKSIAITYVILRRAKRGDFGGGYSIKGNILAPNQFYGMTLNTNSSPFKGKPWANAALSMLNPDYRDEVVEYYNGNPAEFVRNILHLLPSDTTTGDDAELFNDAFETVKNAVMEF